MKAASPASMLACVLSENFAESWWQGVCSVELCACSLVQGHYVVQVLVALAQAL